MRERVEKMKEKVEGGRGRRRWKRRGWIVEEMKEDLEDTKKEVTCCITDTGPEPDCRPGGSPSEGPLQSA